MVPNCGTIRKIEDSYTYDAWGNCSVVVNENNVANINPFRYRGYYFDTESGLYYLMSRYYDPSIGQFISMDTPDYLEPNTIGGVNLYAYGLNNPVMYVDPTGHLAWWAIALIVVGAITIATSIGEAVAIDRAEETYEKYKEEITIEDGQITNSHKVTEPLDMWALSAYARYYSDDDTAQGSAFGIFVEWIWHNVGASFDMAGGDDLNYGKTIFSDFEVHNSPVNIAMPIIMTATELVLNPIMFVYDLIKTFS